MSKSDVTPSSLGNSYLMPDLNRLAWRIHARNVKWGFYDEDTIRPFDGQLMNVVAEVAEAQEEWRSGRGMTETYWSIKETWGEYEVGDALRIKDGQLQVRNYDYDFRGSDTSVKEWLEMTPELLRQMPNMVRHLKPEGIPSELADVIIRVLDLCAAYGIDIAAAIADKMAFNETRPYRHGDKKS